MSFSSKLKPVIGFVIIISVIVVYGLIVGEMKKIPLNYEMISEQEGQDRVLESKEGKLSEPFWIRETLKQEVASVDGNVLEIKSTVLGMDSATNQIVFNNTQTFFVDRESRKHSQSDEYFTFPPNV
ncbi:MAG TPA: histidine kinase, partial [Candidatus Nitrosotenuis sp.]|nr:histidine kinase [Candidatus Nitrosotenuis sp.]